MKNNNKLRKDKCGSKSLEHVERYLAIWPTCCVNNLVSRYKDTTNVNNLLLYLPCMWARWPQNALKPWNCLSVLPAVSLSWSLSPDTLSDLAVGAFPKNLEPSHFADVHDMMLPWGQVSHSILQHTYTASKRNLVCVHKQVGFLCSVS